MSFDLKNLDIASLDDSKRKEVELLLLSLDNKKKFL